MSVQQFTRNKPFTSKTKHFHDLNNDVIFEIFLSFVAIDWDGPFTLTLVCTKWRDIVIEKPRLWTWIMIDDTQTDWKERIDVCAYLSNGLSLQIVLRSPFASEISMTYVTHRCTTLIIECPRLKNYKRGRSLPFIEPVSYETYRRSRHRFRDITTSTLSFLKGVSLSRIRILTGDKDRAAFAYPKWNMYERIMYGYPLGDLLKWKNSASLTDIHFRSHAWSSVQVQLSTVWNLLPMLPHLNYLNIDDSVVKWNKDEALPPICLQRLETLVIDSPANHWEFFSFEHDVWLGLFSLLDSLSASNMENLMLCGSAHRILAAMIRQPSGIKPLKLMAKITVFDESTDVPSPRKGESRYDSIHTFTICIPGGEEAFSHVSVDGAIATTQLLLSYMPKSCSTSICLEKEVDGTQAVPESHPFMPYRVSTTYVLLASSIVFAQGFLQLEASNFSQHIKVQNQEIVTTSLHCRDQLYPDLRSTSSLTHLEDLRCSLSDAGALISVCNLEKLRVLTVWLDFGLPLSMFSELVIEHSKASPRLTTFGIEGVDVWRPLIHLLGNFNKSTPQGGISKLNVPGLPHPSILREIVAALKSGSSGYTTGYLDKGEKMYQSGDLGCYSCFQSSWTCFEGKNCKRFSADRIVSITKDTDVGYVRK